MIKKQYPYEERLHHVRQCQMWTTAGKSIRRYAIKQGINPRTLHGWMSRYQENGNSAETDESVTLVKVGEPPSAPSPQTSTLRVAIGRIVIDLPAGHSDHDLKRVVKTLREIS